MLLMLNNQTHTFTLNSSDLTSLIKSLSASDIYHQRLQPTEFSEPNELQSILDNNDRIKQILKDSLQNTVKVYAESLDNSCPRPSETVKPALVAVDGGIHSYLEALKSISNQLVLLNKCAFDNSILSDAEHYALLEIELHVQQLITGEKIICDEVLS